MEVLDELRRPHHRVVQRTVLHLFQEHRLLLFSHIPFDVDVRHEPGDHVFSPLGIAVVILVKLRPEASLEAEVYLDVIQPDTAGLRYSQ